MATAAAELATELTLADAAGLARRGAYDAALRVLDEPAVRTPAADDLRARIHAQRGDLAAADAAWQRVLEATPDDAAALAGRALIDQIRRGRRPRRPALPIVAVGVAVLVAAAGGVATADLVGAGTARPAGSETPGPDASLRHRIGALASRDARQRADAERTRRRLAALAEALRGPGARVEQRDGDVRVVFDRGLFPPDGTTLSDEGRKLLATWGTRLAGQRVTVTVLGHQARLPGQTPSGGSSLQLARATAAAHALAAASGLPLSAFAVATAEQSAAPYSGDDPSAQDRDRTVTLLVAPVS